MSHTVIHPATAPALDPARNIDCDVTILLVSFNTCALTRQCLHELYAEIARMQRPRTVEVLVVDNASRDDSAAMIEREFPAVHLMRTTENLGFAGGNNLGMQQARGRHLLLLNTDAFFAPGALEVALDSFEADQNIGVLGARLVGRDGSSQPSARSFHSLWMDAITLSGLASRFPRSTIFGAPDRTFADPLLPADVDWVPGAFFLLRRTALEQTGLFDADFFLYYEEVDLCRRMIAAGYKVRYEPRVIVTHWGGESSRQIHERTVVDRNAQVVLWRMRGTLLYYRKHYGMQARLACMLETLLYRLRIVRNRSSKHVWRRERALEARLLLSLMQRAWRETNGGRISPPQPW